VIRKYFFIQLFLFVINCCSYSNLFAQVPSHKTDSLKEIIKSIKTDTGRVKALITLSDNIDCADTLQKTGYAMDALQLAKKIKWESGIMEASFALGTIYQRCVKNYDLSVQYYLRADTIAQNLRAIYKRASILQNIASAYQYAAQFGKAITYNRAVLALKTGPAFDISVYGNMGVIYNQLGDLPNALTGYDSALKMQEQFIRDSKKADVYDTMMIASLYNSIADIYVAMKQYDKALRNYDAALSLAEQTKLRDIEITSLVNIGTFYKVQNDITRAIEYYDRALDSSTENNEEKMYVLNCLANVYLQKGQGRDALVYVQQALGIADSKKYINIVPELYVTLGKIYTLQKEYNKALGYLKKAIVLAGGQGALDQKKDALEAISYTYEANGENALSLAAFRQYVALRDSLYNIDKANELTRIDLQTQYDRAKITDSIKEAGKTEIVRLIMQKQQVYTWAGYLGLVVVLVLSFFIYRNYSQQKQANVVITAANETISEQKRLSDSLLLNILPEEVADELKARGKVKARQFDHVSVMFTDFVNFTAVAERLSPEELVEELHACFEAFDAIIDRYNIEKIKTMGDGYIAASGLPNANPNHAGDLVMAAIEIRDFIELRKKTTNGATFGIRIGISSGGLVAGIVGIKKFAYDIWGDTVNIAARMEQTSAEGKINITEATYSLVKDNFACSYRGEIEAKHKGKLKMYFVERIVTFAPHRKL
jgi:adenylate cyclase